MNCLVRKLNSVRIAISIRGRSDALQIFFPLWCIRSGTLQLVRPHLPPRQPRPPPSVWNWWKLSASSTALPRLTSPSSRPPRLRDLVCRIPSLSPTPSTRTLATLSPPFSSPRLPVLLRINCPKLRCRIRSRASKTISRVRARSLRSRACRPSTPAVQRRRLTERAPPPATARRRVRLQNKKPSSFHKVRITSSRG